MAKYEGDGSYLKLFKELYSIPEYNENKVNTAEELNNLKNVFLQKGFFDATFVGYYDGTVPYYANYTVFYAAKTSSSIEYYFAFLLGSTPRVRYRVNGRKGNGLSLRSVAKSFIF